MYTNIDKDKSYRLIARLENLREDLDKISPEVIDNIAREEKVKISLIDARTTKVVASSVKYNLGVIIKNKYPRSYSFIKNLKPGKASFEFSKAPASKKFNLFVRKLTKDKKYYWNIGLAHVYNFEFDRLIGYFKNTNRYNSIVKNVSLYSGDKLSLHSLGVHKISELKKSNRQKTCQGKSMCTVWHKVKIQQSIPKTQGIKFVGIDYDNLYLKRKVSSLVLNLYVEILLYFLLSLVF